MIMIKRFDWRHEASIRTVRPWANWRLHFCLYGAIIAINRQQGDIEEWCSLILLSTVVKLFKSLNVMRMKFESSLLKCKVKLPDSDYKLNDANRRVTKRSTRTSFFGLLAIDISMDAPSTFRVSISLSLLFMDSLQTELQFERRGSMHALISYSWL